MNAICYLQDLDDENGPLRMIVGSHVESVKLAQEERLLRHSDETLLYPKAGDVVLTHNDLLHSGTPNLSNTTRYFFSVYYNHAWLKHTHAFDGPNCKQLITWAREQNDRRALRLLGVDDLLEARANCGFQEDDEPRWRTWQVADEKALDDSR